MEYLTASQVKQRYKISEMSLWRWLHNERMDFPRPIVINRIRRFKEADLIAWERKRATEAA
ncbi:putative DNA-binding transcriptional regulator AlpA [Rhizobium sp. BK212]|uniref:DNA-binding protein n=1 Tax=Rhizobium sp. BK212 TaxID=2587074 RepID=UPI001607FDB4|nr:DNA-binding protein [Rhizobium sp. BK212]MBB4215580.1 putative DNA-binding transcriptional regulator AlpA [Rhizobium sp. BK212]